MFGAGWKGGAWVLAALALSACGVSRDVYERERDEVRAQVAALRKQLEGQNSQLAGVGSALAELRLRAQDNAAAARESRREAEEARRRAAALEGGLERMQREVASLAARGVVPPAPEARPAAPAAPAARMEKGATARVVRELDGRPLFFAGGFLQPGSGRYQFRLEPGTRVELLGERSGGFVRVKVLTAGALKDKVMWVRARWLGPDR